MNRKQKIIVSTTGIFLVLLILVGLTYAYFLTKINGNTNDKSISVTTANLELKYDDIEQVLISATNVEPGVSFTKKFSATNTGSKKVESYGIALENVVNTLERTKDLVYTLNCTSSLGTKCNGVDEEQIFPEMGKILITNSIESKEVQSYELIVTYKEQNEDQSVDMNKQFSAKVNIVNPSTFGPLGSGTLASAIIDNAKLGTNGTTYSKLTLTSPGNESTKVKFFTTTTLGNEKTMSVEKQYQSYYWTYGTDYTIDEETGGFTLSGVSTCQYSDGTCNETLIGKYIVGDGSHPTQASSETNTTKETINIGFISKVLEAPKSSDNSITIKIQKIKSPEFYSVEKTISKTEDDYGYTYYYRGDVEDNYINFAGMCWRIVRIAGDGSIKLILDNQTTTCKEANGTVNNSIGSGNFGNDESTYSNKIILNYLSPKTDADKSMVNAFETFQKNKLSKYLDNLKSGDWCYQDAVYNGNTLLTEDDKANLYKKGTSFNYDAYNRLWNSTPVKITNKCNGTILTRYSDNTDMYVATLTADEVAYAGGHAGNKGTYFHGIYAGKTYISYEGWLLSPANWSASIPGPFILYNGSQGFGTNPASSQYGGNKNFVPSIQLKANTLISKGTGTISDPYEIK